MIVGVPKEIKNHEYRVGLIPSFVAEIVQAGHEVIVESDAGVGSGFSNDEYLKYGATIVQSSDAVWDRSDFIVKVKEPLRSEYSKIKSRHILFTYLHLASNPELTNVLSQSGAICLAYETVQDANGRLPLLEPMSTIAGRMSILVASNLLQKTNGGSGILPTGMPGVPPANVVILGGGTVGINATDIAHGMHANVTVIDNNISVLRKIDEMFLGQGQTLFSNESNISSSIEKADIFIGSVLIPGKAAPKLVTREMVQNMKKGSVIVDVAIDQGGCLETSRPTTHDDPTYEVNGVISYCVANMPGAYGKTSTIALNNATFPYVKKIADMGIMAALEKDPGLKKALCVFS